MARLCRHQSRTARVGCTGRRVAASGAWSNRYPTGFMGSRWSAKPRPDLYRQFCLWGSVEAVSNGVDLDYFRPSPQAGEGGCVFVGALDYHPNVTVPAGFVGRSGRRSGAATRTARFTWWGRRPVPAVAASPSCLESRWSGRSRTCGPHVAPRGRRRRAAAARPGPAEQGPGGRWQWPRLPWPRRRRLAGLKGKQEAPVLAASSPQEWVEAIEPPAHRSARAAAARVGGPRVCRGKLPLGPMPGAVRPASWACPWTSVRRESQTCCGWRPLARSA